MPHSRFDNLPPDKRNRILQAAAREFGQNGYDGTSLAAVLAAAGISKGAAYYYFEDKADLFETVVYHFLAAVTLQMGIAESLANPEAFLSAMDSSMARDSESFWKGIRGAYLRSLRVVEQTPWMAGLFRACLRLQGQHHGPVDAMRRRSRKWVAQALHVGQRCGAIRTDMPDEVLVDLALAVDQTLDLWMARNLDQLTSKELTTAVGWYSDCLRRVLEPRGSGPGQE